MAARTQQEARPIVSFFIRRFFRIAPLFYLAVIICAAYYGLSSRYWAPNGIEWWYIPLTAFFMHGWHPETITSVVPGGWSIAVEMTFYLFVPYLFSKLNGIKPTLVALFSSLVLAEVLEKIILYYISPHYPESQQYLVDEFAFMWFFSQLPIFILGILLYHIIQKHPHGDNKFAMFLLFASIALFLGLLSPYTSYLLLPGHVLYGVGFLLFSLSLYYSPQKLLVNRVTVFIGKLSFSIYLAHFGVLLIMKSIFSSGFIMNGDIGFGLGFLLVLATSACISYVSYRVVEIPGINLGKRIINKL